MDKVEGGKAEQQEGGGGEEEEEDENFSAVGSLNYYKAADRIPRLFFRLYYGVGAFIYSIMTFAVFLMCCFSDNQGSSFATAGVFDMIGVTVLMWLSAALTLFCGKRSKNLRNKENRGLSLVVLTVVLKLIVDSFIFYILICALRNPDITEANEFFQFAGPLIYHSLLYIVIIMEIVVILITTIVTEDRWGICPIMLIRGMKEVSGSSDAQVESGKVMDDILKEEQGDQEEEGQKRPEETIGETENTELKISTIEGELLKTSETSIIRDV